MRVLRIGSVFSLMLVMLLAFDASVRADQGTEVTITVIDESGAPAPDVEIVLVQVDPGGKPLATAPSARKTNKKGIAIFPFLPYNAQGGGHNELSLNREGFFIRQYRIEARHLTTEIEEGKASPRQKIPHVVAKPGGTVKVDLTIAPIASYQPAPAASAAPAAGAAPAAPAPEAKPVDPIGAAQILTAQGKLSEAEAALSALKKSAPSPAVDFELARVYHLQGKLPEQKEALKAVIAQDANFPKAHYELAKMAFEAGETEEAVVHFEAEVKAYPESTQALQALGSVYSAAGRKDEAIKTFEAVLALDGTNADALVSLDGLYTMEGNVQKSQEVFQKIQAQNPTGADQVYYRVGASLSKRSDLSETDRNRAAVAYRKAVQLNPKNGKAHRELGYTLIGLGKIEEARTHFQAYLDVTPDAKDAATIRQFLQGN